MRANKMTIVLAVLLCMLSGLIFLLPGCTTSGGPIEILLPTKSAETQLSDSARFQEPTSQGPTVAQSAIELSKKYAELSQEATVLRQKNQDFNAKNNQLKDQVAILEAQLQQAQKELTEANDLLIEMRIELNNWKTDVLGFRGEMRDAEKAQLQALLKILEVLGGEAQVESAQSTDIGPTEVSETKSTQLLAADNTVSGETNE
jgi:chromosome segregation ATPase